jgi:hypothetical protein
MTGAPLQERSAQAIHLVHDHDVDLPGVDVVDESLERRPFDVGSGEPAVIVLLFHELPGEVRMVADVLLAGLAPDVYISARTVK